LPISSEYDNDLNKHLIDDDGDGDDGGETFLFVTSLLTTLISTLTLTLTLTLISSS
jgi:hypothetical protein